jgi:chromosome partitioning protein
VHIVAIVNQKGGCGKTTTAINLAGVLARSGFRVLLVDMDPQGHCAAGLAIPEQRVDLSIADALLMLPDAPLDTERLLWRVMRNLDLAPSTVKLAALEAARGDLAQAHEPERRLARFLSRFEGKYDLCLVDCSPAIGMLAYNALVAAHEILIPVETGFFSLQGATKQVNAIKSLGKKLGVAPTFRILPTMYDPESTLSQELLDELRSRFATRVIPIVIRMDQSLRESSRFAQPVIEYAPESTGAADYFALGQYVIEHMLRLPATTAETATSSAGPPADLSSTKLNGSQASNQAPVSPTLAEVGVAVERPALSRHLDIAERARRLSEQSIAATPVGVGSWSVETTGDITGDAPSDSAGVGLVAPILPEPKTTSGKGAMTTTATSTSPASPSGAGSLAVMSRVASALVQPDSAPGSAALAPATTRTPIARPIAPPAVPSFGVSAAEGGLLFTLPVTVGRFIRIAGDFNGWTPERTLMTLNPATGVFEARVPAGPGQYQYRLVVDGQWMPDPFNPAIVPNPFGGSNSLAIVPG